MNYIFMLLCLDPSHAIEITKNNYVTLVHFFYYVFMLLVEFSGKSFEILTGNEWVFIKGIHS